MKAWKIVLHRHKQMLWLMQDEVGRKLFLWLDDCVRLGEELKKAKTPAQVNAVETIARDALALLPKLAPVSHEDPHYAAYKAISPRLSSLKTTGKKAGALSAQLQEAKSIREEYVAALGYVACPLCDASGFYDGSDCPVCGGDREIEERLAEDVNLAIYKKVECPLCKGNLTGTIARSAAAKGRCSVALRTTSRSVSTRR